MKRRKESDEPVVLVGVVLSSVGVRVELVVGRLLSLLLLLRGLSLLLLRSAGSGLLRTRLAGKGRRSLVAGAGSSLLAVETVVERVAAESVVLLGLTEGAGAVEGRVVGRTGRAEWSAGSLLLSVRRW